MKRDWQYLSAERVVQVIYWFASKAKMLQRISCLCAIQFGLLTVEKKGKKNLFNGSVLEIEGLETLMIAQAFELSDAAGGWLLHRAGEESVNEYLNSA